MNSSSGSDALRRFNEADWERMTLRLVKYALFKIRRLEWKSGDLLPKGLTVEDLVLDAIRKTCEGLVSEKPGKGVRSWNPEKNPDLFEYLKGVIDSDVSALVGSAEHRLTNYKIDTGPGGALSVMRASGSAEQELLEREESVLRERKVKLLMDELYLMCVDDEEELLVLLAYQEAAKRNEKIKPSLIAKYAGLDEQATRNAMRRLARKVERRFR